MPSSRLTAYAVAIASSLGACGLRIAMHPILQEEIPYETFYVAVLGSSLYGGVGPGVLAAALGGVAAAYFFVPPAGFSIIGLDRQFAFAIYLVVSAALVRLSDMQRQARVRAEEALQSAREKGIRLEQEITERRHAQAAESLQKQWLEVTLSSIGDGVIATDIDCQVTFINPVAAGITDWPDKSAVGMSIQEVLDIRDETADVTAENPCLRAIREKQVIGLANGAVLLTRHGRRLPIADSAAPIIDSNGAIVGSVLVFRDVSEKRAREAALRELDRMIALCHDAIITTDAEGRILTWNFGAREMYGWDENEVRGRIIDDVLQRPYFAQAGAEIRQGGHWYGELTEAHKDGRRIIAESRQVPLRNKHGGITGVLEIDRDITSRKQSEDELKRALAEADTGRRTLEAVLENIPEGVAIADPPDARIRMISRWGAASIGRPGEELVAIPPERHPETWGLHHLDGVTLARPDEFPLTRAVLHGETVSDEEWIIQRPDGVRIPILCSAVPIWTDGHKISGGLIAWRDLSQRKELEEKLRETAKLESLGVLAGGIAHDFNNLLTVIMGHASLLSSRFPEGASARTGADAIVRAVQLASKLTQQMLAYSGRSQFIIEAVNLSDFVREVASLIRASMPKNIELQFDLADPLPPVEADVAQLQQLVMNLMMNGFEAMGTAGGVLRIVTRSRTLHGPDLRKLVAADRAGEGEFVVLEIEDTGCGMENGVIARIFDPFFSTKFVGRGLGLSAVLGIVRGHRGALEVRSTPEIGTTFRVYLPVSKAGSAVHDQPPAVDMPRDSGLVLVVDDEDMLRSMIKSSLQALGYTVAEARNGEEAVQVFAPIAQDVRIVILDMSMPGISCDETLRRLRTLQPSVRVLLTSGFSETEAMGRFGGLNIAGFLQKPYTVQVLAEKLRVVAGNAETGASDVT